MQVTRRESERSRDLGDCEVHPDDGDDQQEEKVEGSHHQQGLLQQKDALKVVVQLEKEEVQCTDVGRERMRVKHYRANLKVLDVLLHNIVLGDDNHRPAHSI